MTTRIIHQVLTWLIALVWLINGLFCKVLNFVPRHQEIVAAILGQSHSRELTILIGFAEIGMAAWILSGFRSRLNVLAQVILIACMNSLEFILAPGLLLWGRFNALFAFLFILLICYNEFYLRDKSVQHV
jgi:hypothetical protein